MPYVYQKNADGLFVCGICQETKKNQNTMHYHMKKHEGHLPFTCTTCKKEFMHSQSLALHIAARHSNEAGTFVCPLCPFKSQTKANRIIHFMRKHCEEDVKKFATNDLTCPTCNKTSNSGTAFMYHISQCIELSVEKQEVLTTIL